MYFVFHPVHRQSVQGANILVTRSSVHLLLLLSLPLLFFYHPLCQNNLLYQPLILHPAYVTEEV